MVIYYDKYGNALYSLWKKHGTYNIGELVSEQKHSEFSHEYGRFSGHF